MTPQQLRNSILQMAIEGKLVEQRIEDGSSKEFLETILKDVKESNNNGVYEYNKFLNINENDKSFSIPSNWCWVRLGDICSIARGGSPRPIKDYITNDPNGINWIKIGDTNKDDKYINKATEKIKPDGIKKSRFVCPGDFLLTNSMSFGRPYILNIEGCIHDGWLVISQYEKLFDKNFLFWALSSRFAYEQFCKKVSGAVVKNLNIDKVAKSIFPVPPIREQIRIVERIEKIFSLVDLYSEKWEKLEKLNQKFPNDLQKSILQEAIQGKLCEQKDEDGSAKELIEKISLEKERLIESGQIKKQKAVPVIQEDEIPFDIPSSWCWERLGNISTYNQTKPKIKAIDLDRLIWVLDLDDIEKDTGKILRYVKAKDKKVSGEKVVFHKGQILYSKLRPYLKKALIAPEDGVCTPELVPFDIFGGCNRNYILSVLKSPYVDFGVNSATYGVKMPRVGVETMINLLIPIPPIREQERIVKKIDKSHSLIQRFKDLVFV